MHFLRICLFGSVQIGRDGVLPGDKVTHTVQALLAYLLLHRHHSVPRELLAGIFWGDYSEDRARGCLSTALWRLRRVLEPEGIPRGTYLVTTPAEQVGFNWNSPHWLDVAAFEERVVRILAEPVHVIEAADVQETEKALQLYTGELLEGVNYDWALRERERLRGLYLDTLSHLMHYYKHHGAYAESLTCGQRILYYDPLREEIHREMMRLYVEGGQRAQAVRQYEICREILATELGIPPMEETQALYAQIISSTSAGEIVPIHGNDLFDLVQILQQLHLLRRGLDEAHEQLEQIVLLIKRRIDRQHS